MIAACFGDPCGIDTSGLMESAASLFNTLLPFFLLMLGISFLLFCIEGNIHKRRGDFSRWFATMIDLVFITDSEHNAEHVERDILFILELSAPEHRMKLGDDGEIHEHP